MPREKRSSSNCRTRTFTFDTLTAALEQVQALHEISADLIAENVFGQPAQQGQGEPVGYQIRSITDRLGSQWTAWRPCCDTERAMHSPEAGSFNRFGIMRQIRPVFAHADPAEVAQAKALAETAADQVVKLLAQLRDANDKLAEVERLRNRMLACEETAEANAKACAEALTKLAERNALLRRAEGHLRMAGYANMADDIGRVLSGSAEPSAPVERDDLVELLREMTSAYRSTVQAGYGRITSLGGDCDSVDKMLADFPAYAKARAALERSSS